MENIKKNPLSLQLNAEDFLPASNEEKQSLVVMRESVNFWKDGIRRLKKNKIAMVSFVFIIAIAIFAYLLPAVWPYSYSEQMKGSNNLKPFEYSASEQARIDAGEKVFPLLSTINDNISGNGFFSKLQISNFIPNRPQFLTNFIF